MGFPKPKVTERGKDLSRAQTVPHSLSRRLRNERGRTPYPAWDLKEMKAPSSGAPREAFARATARKATPTTSASEKEFQAHFNHVVAPFGVAGHQNRVGQRSTR